MQLCRAAAPPYRSLATLAVVAAAVAATSSCVRPSLPSRSALSSTPPAAADLDRRFAADVQPVLKTYCYTCHSGASPAAMLDLSAYGNTAAIVAAFPVWEHVHGRLERRDMPPPRAPQPSDAERRLVNDWIRRCQERRGRAARRRPRHRARAPPEQRRVQLHGAGPDGCRHQRRLATFPVDPANEAGFDNSGETLAVSPALLGKYLDAARNLADHIVFSREASSSRRTSW